MHSPLNQAISWVDDRLDDFRLDDTTAGTNEYLGSLKAVAELAHAGDVLVRGARGAVGARWIEVAWKSVGAGDAVEALVARHPKFVLAAISFLPFFLIGRRHAGLEAIVATQVAKVEMGPLEWTLMTPTLEIFGIDVPAAAAQADQVSVLARRPAPETLDTDGVYLFAHECLYATRWGHGLPKLAPALVRYIGDTLAACTDTYVSRGDADVVAELSLAAHMFGLSCSDQRVWQLLERAQSPAGNVVPPRQDLAIERLPHPRFTRTYHSTLAAIMTWAACSHGPRAAT